jgi:hypothetical protein
MDKLMKKIDVFGIVRCLLIIASYYIDKIYFQSERFGEIVVIIMIVSLAIEYLFKRGEKNEKEKSFNDFFMRRYVWKSNTKK